jgi:hypothetical protein
MTDFIKKHILPFYFMYIAMTFLLWMTLDGYLKFELIWKLGIILTLIVEILRGMWKDIRKIKEKLEIKDKE